MLVGMNGDHADGGPRGSLAVAADRLAALLTTGGGAVRDPTGTDMEFETEMRLMPLAPGAAPGEVWAVDGGQALVADARCLQVVITRAARVCFRDKACVVEDEGELGAWLLGGGESRATAAGLGIGIAFDAAVDVNLLRDRQEWLAVARCVEEACPGAVVLVDGDLQPDWRIPSSFLAGLLGRATDRGVVLAGVTKRSSLARGGAPLLGQLELEGEAAFGPRGMWWARLAHTRPDVGQGVTVVAARLDADARFAFRVDLPGGLGDPAVEAVLGALAAISDDAAFPGYPYPLTVADRLAACPSWVRSEARRSLDDHLDQAGVPLDVRERAFADRHDLMERA